MAAAARVGDTTTHGGTITGPGVATVLIGGQPAAVAGDMHACSLPPDTHQPTVSAFTSGSGTVLIEQARVRTDRLVCLRSDGGRRRADRDDRGIGRHGRFHSIPSPPIVSRPRLELSAGVHPEDR